MKRLSIIIVAVLALSSFMAITVRASSPHFIGTPTATLNSAGDYCVTFKEAGLGNTPITYTLTAADGTTFTFQCFTKSSNTPQGAPNGVSPSTVSTTSTITPTNGQITATICLTPQQDCASCQGGGLVLKLIHVDYVGPVVLCDTTSSPNVCSSTGSLAGDVTPATTFPGHPAGCP
jgi:hypothetical protein